MTGHLRVASSLTSTGVLYALGGATSAGNINMNSNTITSLANPTNAQDAATKAYVDSVASTAGGGNFVAKTGDTMSGLLDMGSHKISSVTDPTSAQDAATKNYADTKLGGFALDTSSLAANRILQWSGTAWVLYDAQTANDLRYINTNGDTMSGQLYMADNINMNGHTITNLSAPTPGSNDSANAAWVCRPNKWYRRG